MSVLPWDRFEPDQPEPAAPVPPSAPVIPTPVSPQPPAPAAPPTPPPVIDSAPEPPPAVPALPSQASVDVGAIIAATMKETVAQVLPAIKTQAGDYFRRTGQAAAAGQQVDHEHPTVTATTATGRELVVADAKSRSWRTFLQGLCIDMFAALLAILATLTGMDPFEKQTWILVGALTVKTLIQTVISYLARLRITPTIRTEAGAKMAVMPIPRPMLASDRPTRRSDHDAETAPFTTKAG